MKKALVFLVVALLGFSFIAYQAGQVIQLDADQAQIYALTVQNASFQPRLPQNGTCSGASCVGNQAQTGEFSLTYFYSPTTHGWFENQTLKAQGFTPDCISWCFSGIHYFLDPTYVITNGGRNFEQCKEFGASGSGDGSTCTAADVATKIYLSSNTGVPAAADNFASGPCATGNIITTNGGDGGAGTFTAGAAGTTVTASTALTFSFTGALSAVQVMCLLSEVRTGANVLVVGEGTFGPDTFGNGDSLTATVNDALT